MTEAQFRQFAAEGFNRIPLVLETFADLDTPLSVYLKLANRPWSYLLESVQGGERFGRYSFIGLPAETRFEVRGRVCSEYWGNRLVQQSRARRSARVRARLPGALPGGAALGAAALLRRAGRATSATTRCATSSRGSRKTSKPDDALDVPDILLLLSEQLAVVDNLSGKLYLIVYADPREPGAYAARAGAAAGAGRDPAAPVEMPAERPCGVRRAAARVRPGRHSSRRWSAPSATSTTATSCRWCCRSASAIRYAASPLSLYRALRALNPSPYMFYYDMGEFQVVGASPEILVRLEGDTVTLRPIAGTRPRGATRERGPRARGGSARRPEGARRARDADGPGPQRRRPRGPDRQRARHREHGGRALLPRHAHRVQRGRQAQARAGRDRGAAGDVSRPARSAARRRCARWRSSTSWSRASAASTPVRSATSASTATWTSPSPSAPPWSRTSACSCRPAPASSPTRCRRASGWRPRTRRGRCCARPRWRRPGLNTPKAI